MTDDIRAFLAATPVFRDMPADQLEEMLPLFKTEHHRAGSMLLRRGGYSPGLYLLRSGRLVVYTRRDEGRETLAYLQPPAIVGELSTLTGGCCVADVAVEVDAEMVLLPTDAFPRLAEHGATFFQGLTQELARRLQERVTLGPRIPESPIVLLNNHPNWEAPNSFAFELARSMGRQTGHRALLVNLGGVASQELRSVEGGASVCGMAVDTPAEQLRADMAEKLTSWKEHFPWVILNPVGPKALATVEVVQDLSNMRGDLLGPGDPFPGEADEAHFVVQSGVRPRLPFQNGRQQLAFDVATSESAHLTGRAVTPRFQRTVDSIARRVGGIQVGLTLGGGVAWGWAHIGVLSVLENAGVPIDCISGSSMGSWVGGLRSAGVTTQELKEYADYWSKHSKRLFEWRVWHLCILNERTLMKTLRQQFGNRLVNETEIPYWANAVDLQDGSEQVIRTGPMVDCIRASISLPAGLPPRMHNGHLLVDAVVINPVPVNLVRQMGCRFSVAVNAVQKIEPDSGAFRVAGPFSFRRVTRRYPFNILQVVIRCLLVAAHEIGRAGTEKDADVVLRVAPTNVGLVEFSRIPEIVECGRRTTEENLPAIVESYRRFKTAALG
jgi:NTE family protein